MTRDTIQKIVIVIGMFFILAFAYNVEAQENPTIEESLVLQYKEVHEACKAHVNRDFVKIRKAILMELGVAPPDDVVLVFGYQLCVSRTYQLIVQGNVEKMVQEFQGERL